MWENKIFCIKTTELDAAGVDYSMIDQARFVENKLNKLGEEGWEPYGTQNIENDDDVIGIVMMKRWRVDV